MRQQILSLRILEDLGVEVCVCLDCVICLSGLFMLAYILVFMLVNAA